MTISVFWGQEGGGWGGGKGEGGGGGGGERKKNTINVLSLEVIHRVVKLNKFTFLVQGPTVLAAGGGGHI